MDTKTANGTAEWLGERVDLVGFAPVERFEGAPEAHHPARLLQGARAVVVLARDVPAGIFHSPDYGLYLLHRSYHTTYSELDSLALDLSRHLESAGELAVPVPAYAPLRVEDTGIWGLLSLKHAAVLAGLGVQGRNELVFNDRYGSRLRFAAVVTTAELEPSPRVEGDPCPPGCTACFKSCPFNAFEGGSFKKAICGPSAFGHSIYPLALATDRSAENREMVFNTAGYNYWIKCLECQRVCPINRR
jgi:epoxyqueuosine reductase QueG